MKSSLTFIDKFNYLIRLSDKYENTPLIAGLKNKINKFEKDSFYVVLLVRNNGGKAL